MDGLFIAHPTSSLNQYTIDQHRSTSFPRQYHRFDDILLASSKIGQRQLWRISRGLEPIRNGEIFWMHNNSPYGVNKLVPKRPIAGGHSRRTKPSYWRATDPLHARSALRLKRPSGNNFYSFYPFEFKLCRMVVRTLYSKQSYVFCFSISTVFGGKMTSHDWQQILKLN